ncbi:MAG: ATP-binding protein [Gemmatimonadetes bacterium]|nr:ATP-binding protein [Gemmatimonadota bacterium]
MRVETDLELPGAQVRGDPQHLEQILVNLLLNADDAIREASAPGRITVRTSTSEYAGPARDAPIRRTDDPDGIDYSHLRSSQPHRNPFAEFEPGDRIVHIEVSDNGVGIPREKLGHVFEPFFTTKDPGRGTGLGLAVCVRLASGLGGGMTAESGLPEGTRFGVVLPIVSTSNGAARVKGVA